MEEDQLSPEDSLTLIQSMIENAKNTVADESFYFLLWGWLIFIASIIQYLMKVVLQSPYHYVAWSLMIVGVIGSFIHGSRQQKKRKVRTYVDEVLDHLWVGVFFCFLLLGFIFSRLGWENCYTFYILMYSFGSFVSGRILKFAPLVWGAICCWVLVVVSTFLRYDLNILLGAAAILVSYIIPGHLLRQRYRK